MPEQPSYFEIGIYSLGDIGPNPITGTTTSAPERLQQLLDMAKWTEEVGLDVFGVGEHHRLDYVTSSPAVVLAAIARETKNIRLISTTSVLSTLDPIRLYQDFATLDLLSHGRAEIIAGRGAFTESFPLFGYQLADYDALFEEHFTLLQKVNVEERVSWNGHFRPSFPEMEIAPRALQEEIPLWVGVGGTPESAVRAGTFGAGVTLVLLGGMPERFAPLANLYRRAFEEAGHDKKQQKVAIAGHAFLAPTAKQARDEFFPYHANYWQYVNRQRGYSSRMTRLDFDQMAHPDTALFVGSPDEIVEKIHRQYELFGHTRFLAQVDIGGQPSNTIQRSIELLGTHVAPKVRKLIHSRK